MGFGWARSYGSNQHNDEIAAALGILNTFRLNKRIDLTLGTRQMFVNRILMESSVDVREKV